VGYSVRLQCSEAVQRKRRENQIKKQEVSIATWADVDRIH